MQSGLDLACMLHYIWMKIATLSPQKGWKFMTFVIDCLPHPQLPHSHLPKPRVLFPLCRDLCFV